MAEEPPTKWVRESEYIALKARENAAAVELCRKSIQQLATIVRDLVYIVRASDDNKEHDQVLAEHQDALSEIVGED